MITSLDALSAVGTEISTDDLDQATGGIWFYVAVFLFGVLVMVLVTS